ncbi:MerR family DNA-binding protein [Streptomyces sp. NPDC047085]|uniref:MerR family DNA-binding protein n=1 Tax=Streptomyces sp. NPDC047085 TaxID=3155140 RepID=UPI0033F42869
MLDTGRGGHPTCSILAQLLDKHLAETERRIAELQLLRALQQNARDRGCHGSPHPGLPRRALPHLESRNTPSP